MKNLEVALCDVNDSYILKFASFLMDKMEVGIHIFTTTESFYCDEGNYDVAIMSEDFKEIADFKPKGKMGHRYFLCENREEEAENCIYKYQAVTDILEKIPQLLKIETVGANIKKSNNKTKLIGVYSPVAHELQLPFSMALGQSCKPAGGRVLFLDIEEISILPKLIGKTCERNLMDLLYVVDIGIGDIDLNEYIRSTMGFDYVQPFLNPNEVSEVDASAWQHLFELLKQTNYDAIVVLFGRTINGFDKCLGMLDKLYLLEKTGDYFRKSQEMFLDYIERLGLEVDIEDVVLPMTVGNLSDSPYQLEELLHGNLGAFVKRLINNGVQDASEMYD